MRSAALVFALASAAPAGSAQPVTRPRLQDLGLRIGSFERGPSNAITDVAGVRVGHATLREGDDVRTGVTAILPHAGNLLREKVPAAVHVFNAFGKLVGSTQVEELGRLETPVVLTNTLSVWDAAAALADWMLARPGNEDVRSINPVVGETNDFWLNDVRGRHVKAEHVRRALETASGGPVAEGAVGAGTGTVAFGWKGGIGTSSRRLPAGAGGFTVGVLVQSNFGGQLAVDGVPVWRELRPPERLAERGAPAAEHGSCMIVVATDAPLDARELRRLAARAMHGMARTGASGSHGSGDYAIAFSTAGQAVLVEEDTLSPLFQAVIEATEEAILNSLLKAETVRGRGGHVAEAIPIERLREVLRRSGRLP
jgi:D-aminopeptidase